MILTPELASNVFSDSILRLAILLKCTTIFKILRLCWLNILATVSCKSEMSGVSIIISISIRSSITIVLLYHKISYFNNF